MLGMPRFLGIQSLPAGSPGTRKVGFIRGGSTRLSSASSTIPRMAESDRIPEFKEFAVFFRGSRRRRGERRVLRNQRVKVNLSGLRSLP
jgi:hypothetical protein